MTDIVGPERYTDNAVAMWRSRAQRFTDTADLFRADLPDTTRIIVRRPAAAVRLGDLPPVPVTVEDPFGRLTPEPPATRTLRMPVMIRVPGGPVAASPGHVRTVRTAADLADAERVIVDGFPLPRHQPWRRGAALPPAMLDLPGWRFWLAYHGGQPAAAAYTFDDGRVIGVYWLATLPEHRSSGLGRAVMTATIAGHPDRTLTLVATDAGVPLYRSMGFQTVSTAVWHVFGG